jgi:hypothetical protein
MAAILKEIEAQALSLSPKERGELIRRLIVTLEGQADARQTGGFHCVGSLVIRHPAGPDK